MTIATRIAKIDKKSIKKGLCVVQDSQKIHIPMCNMSDSGKAVAEFLDVLFFILFLRKLRAFDKLGR